MITGGTLARRRHWLVIVLAAGLLFAPSAFADVADGEFDPDVVGNEPLPPGASFEDYHHLVPATPEGGVAWELLGATEERVEVIDGFSHVRPVFSEEVEALDGDRVRIRGFMYPLEQEARQRQFLFTALPPTCPYCLPAGAGYIIETHARDPVEFTWDSLLLEGTLELEKEHPHGLFFRLTDARAIDD